MDPHDQWIRDYEFKNEWRRSLPPEEPPMPDRVPTKTTSVTMPRPTYEAVCELAKADGRPFSNYVAWVLARHVEASKGNSPVKGTE